jgi:hypothetical protein
VLHRLTDPSIDLVAVWPMKHLHELLVHHASDSHFVPYRGHNVQQRVHVTHFDAAARCGLREHQISSETRGTGPCAFPATVREGADLASRCAPQACTRDSVSLRMKSCCCSGLCEELAVLIYGML